MRGYLSVVASVCIAVVLSLSILTGPVNRPHGLGHGGTDGVLMPAGDGDPGGH